MGCCLVQQAKRLWYWSNLLAESACSPLQEELQEREKEWAAKQEAKKREAARRHAAAQAAAAARFEEEQALLAQIVSHAARLRQPPAAWQRQECPSPRLASCSSPASTWACPAESGLWRCLFQCCSRAWCAPCD